VARRRELAPPRVVHRELALRADGALADDAGSPGARSCLTLGSGLSRAEASPTDPPGWLSWASEPLERDLDMVGNLELLLDAVSTAADTAWIATLQDIDEDGTAVDVTAGYLRASLRRVLSTSRLLLPVLAEQRTPPATPDRGVTGPPRPQAAPSSA
jgi:uncharacterized protein